MIKPPGLVRGAPRYFDRGPFSALSRAADVTPFPTDHDLYVFLSRRLRYAKIAQKRQSWFGGRLYNRLSGDDPKYIEMSGAHFTQTLKTLDVEIPRLAARDFYRLSADRVEAAVDVLKERLKEQ